MGSVAVGLRVPAQRLGAASRAAGSCSLHQVLADYTSQQAVRERKGTAGPSRAGAGGELGPVGVRGDVGGHYGAPGVGWCGPECGAAGRGAVWAQLWDAAGRVGCVCCGDGRRGGPRWVLG